MADAGDPEFSRRLTEVADRVTVALDQLIPPAQGPEADLMRAMRHSALANGKRMRPFYVIETGAMFDAPEKSLLRAAAALECVHCYSLIHDDLPCMDDDDFRRGQPTVHKAFNEATAVLAGDALLTLAFKILASRETHQDPHIRLKLLERLADCSGALGMVGGQMLDLEAEQKKEISEQEILTLQAMKTGALIRCACETGAVLGSATNEERATLLQFGALVGQAFQLADDILDVTGDSATVGKAVGKDADAGKATFVSLLGLDEAKARAAQLADEACDSLSGYGDAAETLRDTARFIIARTH